MIPVEITRLIPQREPILMVDRLERVEGDSAGTLFLIRDDNFFLEGKRLAEVGIVEHIAQSASALFGYKALQAGVSEPEVRYIGEALSWGKLCLRRLRLKWKWKALLWCVEKSGLETNL